MRTLLAILVLSASCFAQGILAPIFQKEPSSVPSCGGGTVTYVASSKNSCNASSCTISLTPSAAGHTLWLGIGYYGSTTVTSATGTNTYSGMSSNPVGTGSSEKLYQYYAKNASGSAEIVTVNFSGTTNTTMFMVEFSGASATSPLDANAGNYTTTSSATAVSGALTTACTDGLVYLYLSGFGGWTGNTPSPATWTAVQNNSPYLAVFTTTGIAPLTSQQYSVSISTTNSWAVAVAAFKP